MKDVLFSKMFARRTVICYFLTMLLFLTCILRVAAVATGGYAEVQANQSSYRLPVTALRGTIFDRNRVPLTNRTSKTVAAVMPSPRSVMALRSALSDEEFFDVSERLQSGLPVICTVKNKITCDGIECISVPEHYGEDNVASHLIGYTDNSGHGVSGLEAAFDKILYAEKSLEAVFTTNGRGEVLSGISPTFDGDTGIIGNGVVTTIDVNIQNIAENIANKIERGAIVVAKADSCEILAMVSRPGFDANNIANYLEKDDSPLLNRSIAAYSVGSVFKPCIAAAAIETGYVNSCFGCSGSLKIVDRVFNCHNRYGHGTLDLSHALAYSCNCYFYQLANTVGSDPIYKMASSLWFGNSIQLASGYKTAAGNISEKQTLDNPATMANFSIGQGDILLSPVSILTLYSAIATNGSYFMPNVVKGTIENGKYTENVAKKATRVMSTETATKIREGLKLVLSEGTGMSGAPKSVTAAGKTATAQTGRYDANGTEITNRWFCGFFPADDPEYVVITFSEGASTLDTAGAFAAVADGIMGIKNQEKQ